MRRFPSFPRAELRRTWTGFEGTIRLYETYVWGSAGRRLWLETEAASLELAEGENVLGRDERLATRVDGPCVSRRHARVLVRDGRAALEDLDSKNGTFLDGERVQSPRALEDGATIRLGRRASLVFRSDAADPTETEAGDA